MSDEKKISRQLAWQRRKIAQGLCMTCGKGKIGGNSPRICDACHEKRLDIEQHVFHCKPWRPGGPGRPPYSSKKKVEEEKEVG